MEKSEPSLVPEWLRSTAVGNGSGSVSHHFASSQADGPSSALTKRNKIIGNPNASNSSFLSRSSSTNSRKSSSSNGSSKHDTNSYIRSNSSSNRNQRNKGRERLDITDTWDSEYPDSLTSIITGRIEKDTLRRSQSMISRKPDEFSQRRVCTDMRNNSHNTNGHGTIAVASGSSGGQKVSFERDFPLLGSDERPTTPDIIRVSSPGLNRGVQGLSSIGASSLIGNEGWTSALAEVPTVVGSNCVTSSLAPQHPPYATPAPAALLVSNSSSSAAGSSNGLKMAEALVQTPRSHNVQQPFVQPQRSEELPTLGSKRLIPMTPSPKTLVLNPSDKLKPKTAMRSNEVASGPKNGLQPMLSMQMGSHSGRTGIVRMDGPKSSSAGKLLLLKPTRENVTSPALKDGPIQTINVPGVIANGQSISAPSVPSTMLKNLNAMKPSANERKTSYNLNVAPVVDKRLSQAQLRSRNDFFNLVRKKSMSSTSAAAADSGSVSSGLLHLDELRETPAGNDSELKCNGDACDLVEISSDLNESDLVDNAVIYPSEEEEAFLRSLGWEDNTGDEDGLTEEEISAFVQKYMKHKPASKLCQNLQLKIATESVPQASCSASPSVN